MLATEGFHDTAQASITYALKADREDDFFAVMEHVPGAVTKSLQAREHVYFEGDAKNHIYLIESGALSIYKILADGRRQVIDFALPGDIVGLGSGSEHYCSAQATVATKLRALPYQSVHRIARENPDVGMRLYEIMSEELAASRDHIVTVGQRSATQRVVTFLLALSRRNERFHLDPDQVNLPMTRADIADFLGLTIETVSRTITKLKIQKLIELCPAGRVKLLDINVLNNLCAEG